MISGFDPLERITVPFDADMTDFNRNLKEASNLGRQFSSTMIGAFEGVAIKGKNLGDVLKQVALRLSDLVLKAAMKPLEQGIGNVFSSLLSGGGFGFAKGGAFQQGMPVPFASGGVISSPVSFPLANGRMGLAGERGAEAIMPLARGPDGRLGVAARGGSAPNVTINVSTPDADSFRRSETQVAAMLARAVSLGQRNL
jgi:phage-related minor tail protein